ncbi:uncharacterized protein AC631_04928 [Debaryomyces fabryi]|uniref:AB hydrolase-1 domain-containing protein n=1 Tax=Debaryomyces fabryi TaxID=58627 RepID=A0A0V1PT40_9ASCO|nr:uncharacterized protein AC631_04928 [Debaryomyces fabryi]KRZ99305.1 hypothetical protein AC631_04928 [Debaryomyces fabryi]CUM46435.1 unnamed protein product [Debaryomyces fabryi]
MSKLYTLEKKTTDAAFPRVPGSTILSNDRLKIVYNKYLTARGAISKDKIKVNLIFAHGTGMNKSIWNYHIKKLFEHSQSASTWVLNSVLSIDAIGHGDSSLLNEGKIGWVYKWEDGSKDIIQVIKHEQQTTNEFVNNASTKNILIGHSLGGFMAVVAGFYEPSMFDAVIPVEGVLFMDPKTDGRFLGIFSKLSSILIDRFESEEEYNDYFTKFSIYKAFHPEVLKDFMEDEKATYVDPETKETKFMTKASTTNQMTTYYSARISIPLVMEIFPLLTVPLVHVIGSKATWNPPQSIKFIRDAVPKEYLLDAIDIPEGEHLVNGNDPDALVKIIEDTIKKRVNTAIEIRPNDPEVKYGGNKSEILKSQWDLTMSLIDEQLKASKEAAKKQKASKL